LFRLWNNYSIFFIVCKGVFENLFPFSNIIFQKMKYFVFFVKINILLQLSFGKRNMGKIHNL